MSGRAKIFPAVLFVLAMTGAGAARADTLETAGTGVAVALPLLAGGLALAREDWTGAAQLTVDTATALGTAYILKQVVREERPDGSDLRSFPSDTTALAASGAAFLWGRYGWQYGLPAFAATGFVAYSRVESRQHHWYDTLAGAALSVGYAAIFTTRLRERYNLATDFSAAPGGGYARISFNF